MDNYKNFLTISRQVMIAFIPEDKRSEKITNFFLKGATDYQILSVLLMGSTIPLKHDPVHEKRLLTELYTQISSGITYLNEQGLFDRMKNFALAVPTAPLLYPAINLLKSVGAVSGASAVAAKIGAGSAAAVTGGIGTLILVALLVYAAWKTYQRYFSKAARTCKGLSGKVRTKCILKYKLEGRRKQYADLIASKHACSKSKSPIKCNRVMDEKTKAVSKKIGKLREKIEAVSLK